MRNFVVTIDGKTYSVGVEEVGESVSEASATPANLLAQKAEEEERKEELEERKIYVQTKQYIEEVAKEKLGLVKQEEILLKPEP